MHDVINLLGSNFGRLVFDELQLSLNFWHEIYEEKVKSKNVTTKENEYRSIFHLINENYASCYLHESNYNEIIVKNYKIEKDCEIIFNKVW